MTELEELIKTEKELKNQKQNWKEPKTKLKKKINL